MHLTRLLNPLCIHTNHGLYMESMEPFGKAVVYILYLLVDTRQRMQLNTDTESRGLHHDK